MIAQVQAFLKLSDFECRSRLFKLALNWTVLWHRLSCIVWTKWIQWCPRTSQWCSYVLSNHVNKVFSLEYWPYKINLAMSFNKPADQSRILNFIQINLEILEKMSAEGFFHHISLTLNEGQGHSNWYQNVEFSRVYHRTKIDRKYLLMSKLKPTFELLPPPPQSLATCDTT